MRAKVHSQVKCPEVSFITDFLLQCNNFWARWNYFTCTHFPLPHTPHTHTHKQSADSTQCVKVVSQVKLIIWKWLGLFSFEVTQDRMCVCVGLDNTAETNITIFIRMFTWLRSIYLFNLWFTVLPIRLFSCSSEYPSHSNCPQRSVAGPEEEPF